MGNRGRTIKREREGEIFGKKKRERKREKKEKKEDEGGNIAKSVKKKNKI